MRPPRFLLSHQAMCKYNKIIFFTNKKLRAYSLIEVMIAILIIGTAFFGLIQAFPLSLKITKAAENKTKASYFAQEKIEALYELGYDNFSTGTIEPKHRLGATSTERWNFQRETTAEHIDKNLQTSVTDYGMKKITTTVYYTDAFSKSEISYSVTTILTNR